MDTGGTVDIARAPAHLSPENAFLVLCCRSALRPEESARLRVLAQRLDWQRVLEAAARHHVIPSLHLALKRHCPEAVPQRVVELLEHRFLENAALAMLLSAETIGVWDALRSEGIDALPFKGVVLSAAVRGNVRERQAGDIDLLIRCTDRLTAARALERRGYRLTTPLGQRAFPAEPGKYEFHFERTGGPSVELRWRITQRQFAASLDLDFVWGRRVPLALGGRQFSTIAPEDLTLVLCAHGAKHRWSRVQWDLRCRSGWFTRFPACNGT